MHKTRNSMPKEWPVKRKGTTYFLVANHSRTEAIPLGIVLRDVLKIAKTLKEARFMILQGDISVNGKIRKDQKFPLRLFDILSIKSLGKNYKLDIAGKKINLQEISEKEKNSRTIKIVGKNILKNKSVQINLKDGNNFLIKEKFSVGDSAVLNVKENKIEKIVGLKEGSKVYVVDGKHSGKEGKVKSISHEGQKKNYLIKLEEKEVLLPARVLLAIE